MATIRLSNSIEKVGFIAKCCHCQGLKNRKLQIREMQNRKLQGPPVFKYYVIQGLGG